MIGITHSPDWSFWALQPYIEDWQAAALSLGLDPDAMIWHRDAWMGGPGSVSFEAKSFPDAETGKNFHKRFRLVLSWVAEHGDRIRHHNTRQVNLREFAAWVVANAQPTPQELVDISKGTHQPAEVEAAASSDDVQQSDSHAEIAAYWDAVGPEQLETMFPASGNWKKWARKAHENKLRDARTGRGLFNPYLAAMWWLEKRHPERWDNEKCMRKLINNLPARSSHMKEILDPGR